MSDIVNGTVYVHLIAHLAAAVLAQQTGSTVEVAADVLGQHAGEGKLKLRGDAYDAYLEANGKVLVHVTREFLAFFASHPNEVIDLDKYAQPITEHNETMAMPWPWRCIRCHRGSDTLDEHKMCAQCAAKEKP